MKRIIATFVLAVVCGMPIAQTDDALSFCKSVSETAGNIMKSRQGGVKMADLMGVVNPDGDELGELLQAIVIRAFEEPAYSTDRNQQRTIREFENSSYLECVQAAIRRDQK